MRRPGPAFKENESAILIALYENPNASHTSYTIAHSLHPTIKSGTPQFEVAWTSTRDATEELIVQGLVRGERLKGADGVYFNDLELTPKGERTAIQEKRRRAEMDKALSDIEEEEKS